MATLSDVARMANVSPAAVSRHLNGRIKLPAATQARIDAAIKALDYRPNLMAKRLSTGRTEAIGLVTPEISNPFFAELAAVVEDEAASHGYDVYISSTRGDASREVTATKRLRDRHVDGLIMMTNRADDGTLARALDGLGNLVIIDEDIPGAAQSRIFVENRAGGRIATEHLVALGHRDIATVTGPAGVMSVVEREQGWADALDAAGLPRGRVIAGDYSRASGREAARQLLAEGPLPTAIVAAADDIAIGLIETFREAGIDVPGDISITGFDDMRYSALVAPALTTVHQPVAELGRLAFSHLRAVMDGKQVEPLVRLPVSLTVRNSTAKPRS
ncbi:LacI family DNA-binding transcriptional regulator [Pelagovum pacificum]|uniref:LacI family transcriptional regulator n=1 Tax=Pelagovum pacificum TaxID=2588711 RepID=A0A5C5GF28_9RHOB|nr:LacI family DNA-binding transcriptional regulator [Pelagovum pacificum]QQA44211.1 LacI family DNA-binding transcriptional regulator [Pelagovum pacificum]TNY32667.1 LacI family transcriptional regulator [Pelagovum pacificum]